MPQILLVFLLMIASTRAYAEQWSDIPEEGELRIAVDALTEANVLEARDTFRPDDNVLRAELAALLARATLKPAYVMHFRGSLSYQDIAPDDWFAPSVEALKQSGAWNTGKESRLFFPYHPATRAAFLHALFMMTRENMASSGAVTPLALDVLDGSAWYYPALSTAVSHALLAPDADGMLHPLEPITRREAALWLYAYRHGTRPADASFSSWALRLLFAEARGMLGSLFVLP